MKLTPRTLALTVLKLILMVGLLALVLRQVQWRDAATVNAVGEQVVTPGLASTLQAISPLYYGLAALCLLGSLLSSGMRWQRVLSILGLSFRRSEVVKLVFIGDFFNNFLLGSLGGDAVKVFLAVKSRPHKAVIVTSIFADRLIGLVGLTVHAAIMLLLLSWQGSIERRFLWLPATPITIIGVGLIVGGTLLFASRLHQALKLEKFARRIPGGLHLQQAAASLRQLFGSPGHLLQVFALTLCCQFFSISTVAFLGACLQLGLPLTDYLLYVPIVFILSAVPVTPGGIGVLEELCLIYFAAAANPNKVLVLALLIRLTILLTSLPGLVFFWGYGQKATAIRAELEREEGA